jgi:hypothetical protein
MYIRKAKEEFETLMFRHCRDHRGNVIPIDIGRRNGITVPQIPRSLSEPYLLPEDPETPDYEELVEELCQNLNAIERRRWLLAIRDKQSNTEIAATEGVTRQAIIDCFRRMAKRNPYVEIWLAYKNRRNQHE